ncbi:penicillin-binding protein 1C [Terasakiella pusilla]|uniref:penicillin-binding protein 1C n=1 Tax=Terasakiella pusilla TaxID=64973 RepID=UPI003AA9DB3E
MRHLLSTPKQAILWAGMIFILALSITGFTLAIPEVPSFDDIRDSHQSSESTLRDRHGEVLHVSRSDFSGRRLNWTPLSDISPALIDKVLRAEDQRFFDHEGVDFLAIAKAASALLTLDRPRGASTITMQLTGFLAPSLAPRSSGRSILQKWRQMRMAWDLEQTWTKREILESYLNLITYRSELKGIAAASKALFAKAPSGLNTPESAILAALIRGPNANKAQVEKRACLLLVDDCEGLKDLITSALTPPYQFPPLARAAYHAFQRLHDPNTSSETILSTLDGPLQHFVNETVRGQVAGLTDQNLQDAAVLVVDNKSGEILAYVGSSGSLSDAQYVDGVQARRQAGSTLKPFVYGLAIERKYLTAATLLEDGAIEIPISAGGVYRPRNYDSTFHGPVTVREALASSLNTPAVRAILTVGTNEVVKRLNALGFKNLMAPEFYGASLALGSADVTLWELTNAYRTLANGGRTTPLTFKVNDKTNSAHVQSEGASYVITSILSDRLARALGFGLSSPLNTPYFSAVKTGTSKDMRDNWTIGYSSDYTVGVWAGNFSGQPMWNVSGVSGAAPIWRTIMDYLHRDRQSLPPSPSPDVVTQTVSLHPSGRAVEEFFLDGTQQGQVSTVLKQRAKIIYPTNDTLLSVDPDIPASLQKIHFQASGLGDSDFVWQLNKTNMGQTNQPFYWSPAPGHYTLSLITASGEQMDEVRFTVR